MNGRRYLGLIVASAALLLAGCGSGATPAGPPDGGGLDRQRQQARDALARYDLAVAGAAEPRFTPVGELTGQIGDWEQANGENKRALGAGRLVSAGTLSGAPPSAGAVVWDSGATRSVPLLLADTALGQMISSGTADCPECVPLQVTGAKLSTVRIQTTRGPATVPAWEYTLAGTAVRVTRVAVDRSAVVVVTPPSWDPNDAPAGLAIESATTAAGSNRLTVVFTGAGGPKSQPCGADYTTEVVESAGAVAVIVTADPHAGDEACVAMGFRRTAEVELSQPLGERAVLEVQQGMPVPVTIAP